LAKPILIHGCPYFVTHVSQESHSWHGLATSAASLAPVTHEHAQRSPATWYCECNTKLPHIIVSFQAPARRQIAGGNLQARLSERSQMARQPPDDQYQDDRRAQVQIQAMPIPLGKQGTTSGDDFAKDSGRNEACRASVHTE